MDLFQQPKLLGVAQLNDKSQLVIPKIARDELGLKPGDRLVIALAPFGKALVLTTPNMLETHLEGMLRSHGQSVADMKDQIKNHVDTWEEDQA